MPLNDPGEPAFSLKRQKSTSSLRAMVYTYFFGKLHIAGGCVLLSPELHTLKVLVFSTFITCYKSQRLNLLSVIFN